MKLNLRTVLLLLYRCRITAYVLIIEPNAQNNILLTNDTLICMNDLTGAKMLIGELLLCNAVKDISFTSKIQFKN
jgi:hypothetical protein